MATLDSGRLRLNGWQRLWVVFSGLTAMCAVLVAASFWPKSEKTELRAIYAIELALQVAFEKARDAGNQRDELNALRAMAAGAATVRARDFSDTPANVLIQKLRPTLKDTPQEDAYIQREFEDLKELRAEKLRLILYSLTAWLCISTVVYCVGWSIAWVRRGFRPGE
jgi:hypothetical protein